MDDAGIVWPELRYQAWHETAATLHLCTQIAGKVRLALTPWLNHSWQVPLYVTARGLSTSSIPVGGETLEIDRARETIEESKAREREAGASAGAADGRRFLRSGDRSPDRHRRCGYHTRDAERGARSHSIFAGPHPLRL